MKFYTAEYSHENDRMEKTSPLFETYREARDYLEACGKRNEDNELIGMIGNDFHGTMPETQFATSSADGNVMSNTRKTTTGWRATIITKSGRRQTRLFRAKYVNNLRAAQEWIHEQIRNYDGK